jgi:hypothetical protein
MPCCAAMSVDSTANTKVSDRRPAFTLFGKADCIWAGQRFRAPGKKGRSKNSPDDFVFESIVSARAVIVGRKEHA